MFHVAPKLAMKDIEHSAVSPLMIVFYGTAQVTNPTQHIDTNQIVDPLLRALAFHPASTQISKCCYMLSYLERDEMKSLAVGEVYPHSVAVGIK